MLPVWFKSIVTRLDAGSLTTLMRGLLQAEADRLGLPPNAVVVSDALTEADGGLDARMHDVPAESQYIPIGLVGFQFKARKTKTVGNLDLDQELAKPGPTRILKDEGTYVLVWQADLNDKQRSAAESTLQEKAKKVVEDPNVDIWDATAIVALAERHPAVVEGLELAEFGAVRGLSELDDTLRVGERPYEADAERTEAIRQIRERANAEDPDPIVVTVHGLAGTGKTRLVVEALDANGLRDRVLYASSAEGLHTFVGRIVKDERTEGILVVDELDDSDRKAIHERLAATRGRWRLVAIVPQATRGLRAAGARDVLLPPLSEDATQRLVEATSGLPEAQARTVANVARGFPELAFRLAEELSLDPSLDLVQLAHLDRPNDVLRRALPEENVRRALKPLSLFTGIGVDGELGYQIEEVAAAFGRSVAEIRQVVDIELRRRRFVSAAGRYRLVSPTLVAIWLAVELIDETPDLDQIISRLSPPVQEAFYDQLELFGPHADQLAPALERLLRERRFQEPGAFDEAAGRFLRASAAIVPSQVAAGIDSILRAATQEQLRTLPRRDLVWALQILLWWPGTWKIAITNLYRLAQRETETWANNATGQFREAFSVYLSGSTVPYEQRIRWLSAIIADASEDELPLLGDAAAFGLRRHHARTVVGFRGGGEPRDWQPETVKELRDARTAAWRALLQVVDRAPEPGRAKLVQAVGKGIWTMVFEGLVDVVDADLRRRGWSQSERAEMLGDVQRLIRLGDLPDEIKAKLWSLRSWLEGDADERLDVVLATPVWELQETRENLTDDPPVLVRLADSLSSQERGAQLAVAGGGESANPNTRYRFLRLVAQRAGAEELARFARDRPLDVVAYAAALSVADGLGEREWVDHTLIDLARSDAAVHVPLLVTYAEVSTERIALALDVVEAGGAPAQPLVNLRGGGRFRELPEELADRLFRVLSTHNEFEGALGIILQWIEGEDGEVPRWLRDRVFALSQEAITVQSDTVVDYYVKEFVTRGVFDPAHIMELWDLRMRHRSDLLEELDEALTERALVTAPRELLRRVLALIRDEAAGTSSFSLLISRDLALLSRSADVLGVEEVWEALTPLNEHEFRLAVHHMRWSGDRPDPLVAHFLSSSRLHGYESEAYTAFFNTLGVVSGAYWQALEREHARAQAWHAALEAPSAKAWAADLVRQYGHDIESHRAREEEEDFRLGR
jgi:hypothetical protein